MIKVFFTPLWDPKKQLFLYESFFSDKPGTEQFLFKPKTGLQYNFQVVTRAEDADVIIESSPVTHGNVATWKSLERTVSDKPRIVQVGGDLSHDIFLDDPIVLKVTQYKDLKRENEVIMPPFCEDLGTLYGFVPRKKHDGVPVVSFCGWAGFSNAKAYVKYLLKLLLSGGVYRQGMYFRRKSIAALKKSSRVETSFVLRNSFSGSSRTIGLDPQQARAEYVKNMADSDFVLAPKGDANYSVRFFEALSMGRIPVLIDTDVCLPFENKIDYSKCVLRVSWKDLSKLPDIIADFYAKVTAEEWLAMQNEARRVFVEYLRYDAFWNKLLDETLLRHN